MKMWKAIKDAWQELMGPPPDWRFMAHALPEGATFTPWPVEERLKVVELLPGDTLVIETEHQLTDGAVTRMKAILEERGYKAIIMEQARLRAVLRKGEYNEVHE